jgi:predicted Rossmann-fold nucleotide-binding protein
VYFAAARDLGAGLARRGWSLIYGGGGVGLMGAVAEAVRAGGGKVVGIIPQALLDRERAYLQADELIVTTITHDHADRVRSYRLLAEEWHRR